MVRAIRTSLVLALFLVAFAVKAAPFTGLAIIGDSLADTGNNAQFFDEFGAFMTPPVPPGTRTPTPIPNALTEGSVIPTFPYSSDRYSNGSIWVEQLAAALGLSAQASLLGGTNFAFGGARTGPTGSSFPFSLMDQVEMFLAATGGAAPSDWLYIVIGGGNDVRDAVASPPTPPGTILTNYTNNMTAILTELTDAGADHILLANVPDVGLTPAVQLLDMLVPGTAAGASALAALMNASLLGILASLSPEAVDNIDLLDTYALLNQVALDPSINSTLMCATSLACIGAPGNVFFWDGIHPTTFGHSLLAQAALRAIPEPATLSLVAIAFALLMRRRA
jgi:phospholipase/lecithinase/hemolysin